MTRLIILILLLYILYRLLKAVFLGRKKVERTAEGEIIDEMVQDPLCDKYIPRREAIRKVIGGKEYFFCSEECASRFMKE